ncbi:hypothetical protein F5X68DRAFT_201085 [Plectosphaerella plurivora]|uniref:Uncharacterized protein n=1 Tax=Plectosphaerella plurivora TaxID=936078 RepID=A0A9P9AE88_9PEZI|nr:hypothetical protein F5X68DRAFT_201085 [Plectosphaerella plurivora]
MPEMESWEVAPGHIRDGQKGGRHENVAFSNAYITSNSAIAISPDIGFNVATIKPGSSYKLEANPRILRVCSVASGKLRVKLDENKFQIGCNGVFKVRGGSKLTVENRLYVDSVLHITSISEY